MLCTATVALPAPIAAKILPPRAVARGSYVRVQLAFDVAAQNDGWSEDDDAEDEAIAAELDRTGVGVPWDEVRTWKLSWGSDNELPAPAPRKLR